MSEFNEQEHNTMSSNSLKSDYSPIEACNISNFQLDALFQKENSPENSISDQSSDEYSNEEEECDKNVQFWINLCELIGDKNEQIQNFRFNILMDEENKIWLEKQIKNVELLTQNSIWTQLVNKEQVKFTPYVKYVQYNNNNKREVISITQEYGMADLLVAKQRMNQFLKNNSGEENNCWNYFRQIKLKLFLKLYEMHEMGIAHGDIKPQNIVILQDFEPYFIDFDYAVNVDHIKDYLKYFTPYFNHQKVLNTIIDQSKEKIINNKQIAFLIDHLQLILSFLYLNLETSEQINLFKLKNFEILEKKLVNDILDDQMNEMKKIFLNESFEQYKECEKVFLNYLVEKDNQSVEEYIKTFQLSLKSKDKDITSTSFTHFLKGFKINEDSSIEVICLNRYSSVFLNQQKNKQIVFNDDAQVSEFINIHLLRQLNKNLKRKCKEYNKFDRNNALYYISKQKEQTKQIYTIESVQQLSSLIQSFYLYPSINTLSITTDKNYQFDAKIINKLIDTLQYIPNLNNLSLSLINQSIDSFSHCVFHLFTKVQNLHFECSIVSDVNLLSIANKNFKDLPLTKIKLDILSSQINDDQLEFLSNLFKRSNIKVLQLSLRNSGDLTDQSFSKFLKSLLDLQNLTNLDLDLSMCQNVKSQTVKSLIELLEQNKKILDIKIDISYCQGIQNESINKLLDSILKRDIIDYSLAISYYFFTIKDDFKNKIQSINSKFKNKVNFMKSKVSKNQIFLNQVE